MKSNLAFNKYNDELIGFVDLGDPELNYSTFQDSDQLATHALVYYICGLCSSLKFSLAYFATHCATSYRLMPIFWKAVSSLELACKLHVTYHPQTGNFIKCIIYSVTMLTKLLSTGL